MPTHLSDPRLQLALRSHHPVDPHVAACWILLAYINWESDFLKFLNLLRAYDLTPIDAEAQFHEEGFITLQSGTAILDFLSDSAQCPASDLHSELERFWTLYQNLI